MGVLLQASDDSRASAASITNVTELTCLWWAQSSAGKLSRLRCSASVEALTGHALAAFQDPAALYFPAGLWFQIVHTDDRAAYLAAWQRLERGEEFDLEYRIVHTDGRVRWVKNRALGGAEDGTACGMITDITERKRADEEQAQLHLALQCVSAEWRLMFDAASAPMLMLDAEGRVLRMNQTAQRLAGWSYEQALGQRLTDLSASSLWVVTSWLAAHAIKRRRMQSCEVHEEPADRWWEITASQFADTAIGARVIVVLRDSTAHKRAEAALRQADHRAQVEHERLLERLGDLAQRFGTVRDLGEIYQALRDFACASAPCHGISISLIENGIRRAAYASCDGQEVDISGTPSVKLGATSPHARALASGQVVITDDFQKAYAGHNTVPLGFDIDPRLPRSSLVAPMSVMGRIVGSVEIQATEVAAFNHEHATAMRMAANLTAVAIENTRLFERERQRDEQLRQAQKMEAIGRLAGGVAHDFNNLLTAIIGYGQLLQTQFEPSEPAQNDIAEIVKAGQRAAALTSQLLAFSRKQVIQPKVLDLNAVIADLQKMLGRLIGEHIELVAQPDARLGRIKADPGQIEQVVMNLAINARDAMPQGGRLTISTSNLRLTEAGPNTLPGDYVVLTVSDTGCGMDRETLSHIFEPFFTTKEMGRGTGLGLSTVYGIVRQSGGDIHVDSAPGRGTTFKIYIPRVAATDEEVRVEAAAGETKAITGTVLLVEDEAMVRQLVRSILQMRGFKVIEATDGVDALAASQDYAGAIDLLLTDVVMPRMGGPELAEHMRQLRPTTPALFMSGYTDDGIVHHGVLDDGLVFIQKPFTPDALIKKVCERLDEQKRAGAQRQQSAGRAAYDDAAGDASSLIH
ncbi:MAG TPA: ATP-binding protein [Blastocatellia bacterium]|nr:ATP-binding protein [Blastocatellia bacterium]